MQRIDIRKYPLTNRLCQTLFKESATKKAVPIVIEPSTIKELQYNKDLDDKYKNNKYLKYLAGNSVFYRKLDHVPRNNANLINLDAKKATYYSFNYIKKNAEIVEKLLDTIMTDVLYVHFRNQTWLASTNKVFGEYDSVRRASNNYNFVVGSNGSPRATNSLFRATQMHSDGSIQMKLNGRLILFNEKNNRDSADFRNVKLHLFSNLMKVAMKQGTMYTTSFLRRLTEPLNNVLPKEECKIGKVFNKVFDQIKPNEIEEIINCYIGINKTSEENKKRIVELSGDEIVEFYNKYKYDGFTSGAGGTLNSSCMKYVLCRDRLDIYARNPDIIKMIVLFSPDFKHIEARALLWDGKYVDRIYFNKEEAKRTVRSYTIEQGYINVYSGNGSVDIPKNKLISVQLKEWSFQYYPYFDTFHTINQANGQIYANTNTNFYPDEKGSVDNPLYGQSLIRCQNHSTGTASLITDKVLSNQAVTIFSKGENKDLPIKDVVYSTMHNDFINKKKAIYVGGLDDFDYILNSKKYDYCIKINSGSGKNNILFKADLYPVSESVFIEELSCRVHISSLNYNEETCEFELVYPNTEAK